MISIHLRANSFLSLPSLFAMQIYSDMRWLELFWVLEQRTHTHTHSLHQQRYITHSDSCSIKILTLNGFLFPWRPKPDISACNQSLEITSIQHACLNEWTNCFSQGQKQNAKWCVWYDCDWSNRDAVSPSACLSLWPAVAMAVPAVRWPSGPAVLAPLLFPLSRLCRLSLLRCSCLSYNHSSNHKHDCNNYGI